MADREPKTVAANFIKDMHVLIMAGGSGTRFWPKSRVKRPKQLLALWDEKTLLEHTVERFSKLVPIKNIWIVTTEALVEPSKEALSEKYRDVHFLGEPAPKNTAPCILWGTYEINKANPNSVIAVMPADHYIGDEDAFATALQSAVEHARSAGGLVTLGVTPNRPETGFGYIETEKRVSGKANDQASREKRHAENLNVAAVPVTQFVEKPELRTALRYIESGKYLWNAGMFIFTPSVGLNAFEKTMPELYELFVADKGDAEKIYSKIGKRDAVSVDFGVMEAAISKNIPVSVVPVDCGWNDVGSFPALEEIDCTTMGDVIAHQASSNIVQTDTGLVALLGVNDLVVVRDGDVVLVCAKDRAQDIKVLLEKVKAKFPEKV